MPQSAQSEQSEQSDSGYRRYHHHPHYLTPKAPQGGFGEMTGEGTRPRVPGADKTHSGQSMALNAPSTPEGGCPPQSCRRNRAIRAIGAIRFGLPPVQPPPPLPNAQSAPRRKKSRRAIVGQPRPQLHNPANPPRAQKNPGGISFAKPPVARRRRQLGGPSGRPPSSTTRDGLHNIVSSAQRRQRSRRGRLGTRGRMPSPVTMRALGRPDSAK